jgi:mono/diheme cytochrome c family protein/uncharacterized cupredoxin-like copper-binding protein
MRRRRLPVLFVLSAATLLVVLNLVSGVASARTTHPVAAKLTVTTVLVTVGKPSEFAFTLSKKTVPVGTIIFKVTNKGKLPHTFEICTAVTTTSTANSCKGKVTATLATGKSQSITALALLKGLHEFLCTVAGHAAAGMKGLLGVGVSVTASASATGSTATGGTTSGGTTGGTTSGGTTSGGTPGGGTPAGGTPAGGTTAPTSYPTGNASNGKSIFLGPGGCGGCHALAAAGTPAGDGPALDGTNLSVSQVESQVAQGGGGMPGYAAVLSAQQIADVATFVSQSST